MTSRWFSRYFVLLLGLALAVSAGAQSPPEMPQHSAPVIVPDMFRFIEGTWAEYEMLDKNQNQSFTLKISILEQEQVRRTVLSRRRNYRWMEFEVHQPNQPSVVIRYLAREQATGPGELREAIIQMENIRNPLRLGSVWLRENDKDFVNAAYRWADVEQSEEEVTLQGHTFNTWRVVSEAKDGTTTATAVVSEAIPPLGLYFAETSEIRMQLKNWGTNAQSAIRGQPLGLTSWIYRQMQDSM